MEIEKVIDPEIIRMLNKEKKELTEKLAECQRWAAAWKALAKIYRIDCRKSKEYNVGLAQEVFEAKHRADSWKASHKKKEIEIADLRLLVKDSEGYAMLITHHKDHHDKDDDLRQQRDGLAEALDAGNHFICLIPNEIKLGSETRIIAYQKYLDTLASVQDE